ncbi:SDR family oxidoreductase [Nonomuraea sp. SBT364]|uniref:SDR family oxidoreductase n=1 Tax=Nonomuraea sp. SBT364 TaxID=1580530 RepID=UPI00066DB2A8|nr:SDR family oxidoreductase [Nonomuraea sp. SBT364]
MTALSPDAILLSGRVAVVTGAAGGSGRVIAGAFAAFGAHVAACDRDKPQGEPAMTLDVRDPVASDVFARAVEERWGRVDVLVNAGGELVNAQGGTVSAGAETVSAGGETAVPVTFGGLSERDGRRLIDEGFTRVTGMVRRMLPLMGAGASIINVVHGDGPVRAMVESLTRSLAAELRPRGIRVNALALESAAAGAAGPAVFLAGPLSAAVTGVTLSVGG